MREADKETSRRELGLIPERGPSFASIAREHLEIGTVVHAFDQFIKFVRLGRMLAAGIFQMRSDLCAVLGERGTADGNEQEFVLAIAIKAAHVLLFCPYEIGFIFKTPRRNNAHRVFEKWIRCPKKQN